MHEIIEVAAARVGGRIPLGIMTLQQALKMPHTDEFRYRHITNHHHPERVMSRQELEKLARHRAPVFVAADGNVSSRRDRSEARVSCPARHT